LEAVNIRAALIAFLVALAALATACGDPSTQVFVVNRDSVPYYLTFTQGAGPGDRSDVFVPARGQGLLFSSAGETGGVVLLRRTDCSVVDETPIFAGQANLIAITGSSLQIDDNADLSSLTEGELGPASDCIGV
jgi:hypothetical protein